MYSCWQLVYSSSNSPGSFPPWELTCGTVGWREGSTGGCGLWGSTTCSRVLNAMGLALQSGIHMGASHTLHSLTTIGFMPIASRQSSGHIGNPVRTSFTMCQNSTDSSSKRQSEYCMESFVPKGRETRHRNVTNNISCETELSVDNSCISYSTIKPFHSFFPSSDKFHRISRAYVKIPQFAQANASPNTYGTFCVERL